jgi:hypothetical protein
MTLTNGKALTPKELVEASHYIANLIVEDWPRGGVFARHIHQARLLDMNIPQAPRDVIPSLFDRQLVRMLEDRIILHGYQIQSEVETGARKFRSSMGTVSCHARIATRWHDGCTMKAESPRH